MKDFLLNEDGDIVIASNKIQLVSDKELTVQKVRQVVLTSLGEWEYDLEEGISRHLFFEKGVTEDLIEENIRSGLLQVDETFRLTKFSCEEQDRRMIIRFTAVADNGNEISLEL